MAHTHHARFVRTDIWREGKWLDLWSVVHFLSGVSVAFVLWPFFDLVPATVITLLLLIAYEMWEAMVQIHETPQNRFMDVVVGMVSYSIAHAIGIPLAWSAHYFLAFGIILTLNIALAALGWYESQKAAELEKRMLARIEAERAAFRERRLRRFLKRQNPAASHREEPRV